MVSGTPDDSPHETTLASVYMWKRFVHGPSQSWPCMIIHNTVLHDCRVGIRYVSDSIYDFSFEVPSGANIPHLLGQIVP